VFSMSFIVIIIYVSLFNHLKAILFFIIFYNIVLFFQFV
jgi:hypothetical protein